MYAVPLDRDFRPERYGWSRISPVDPQLPQHGPEYARGFCFHGRHFLRWEYPYLVPAILCQPYARSRDGYYSPPLVQAPALLAPSHLQEAVRGHYRAYPPFPVLKERQCSS